MRMMREDISLTNRNDKLHRETPDRIPSRPASLPDPARPHEARIGRRPANLQDFDRPRIDPRDRG
jgi:hypothetical protein